MDKKVLLIVNPVAGTRGGKTALFDMLAPFCKKGWEVTVQLTQRKGHARKLAASAGARGYELVCCAGGDGTLNEVLSGIAESGSRIPLGYIPCGTTNDFADTLGIPSEIYRAAGRIALCRPRALDLGKFGEDRYFSYIASFGAFTSASYDTPQELKNSLGHFAYLLAGVADLSKLRPQHIKFTAGGKTREGDYIFGAVSNTTSVGGIVKLPEERVDLSDGLFEVILVKFPRDAIELNNIVSGVMMSNFNQEPFEFFETSSIEFETEDTLAWSLDGEKAESKGKILIEDLPSAAQLYL